MRIDRLNDMEEHIIKCGSVSLEKLAEHFQISINTVRRDVDELLNRNNIKKVYGGVVSITTSDIIFREQANISAKQTIGSVVAPLIKDNTTVFIDSGTTTAQVIPHLSNKSNITVITNSLKAMFEVSKYPNINLLGIGGSYDHSKSSFIVGSATIESMANLNFDMVLIGTTCVSLENGLTINSHFEVDIKRWLVENNKNRIVLMADADKYDKSALYSFCSFNDVNIVAADRPLPRHYIKRMSENGTTFICPEG
jgi:DeoR family myo-inositol catabolism operon transcriptional repressor